MSMGESTRRRLEGAVRNAANGSAPAQYVGGWNGGLGGTWGKAQTGRGGDNAAPARPGTAGRGGDVGGSPGAAGSPGGGGEGQAHAKTGVREKTRPASAGVKSAWHDAPRELPKAPPHALTSGKVRPGSAKPAHTTRPLATMSQVEWRVQGMSLEPSGKPLLAGTSAGATQGGGVTFGSRPSTPGSLRPATANKSTHRSHTHLDHSQRNLDMMRERERADGSSGIPSLTEAHLAALEDAIRDAVRSYRTVYEGSEDMLMKLFRAVDDGSGDVSIPEFCQVCGQVGVSVSPEEAGALFRRFGYDRVMPYEKFVHVLVTQPARQLAEDMPVRKGAFEAGGNANFNGKILYRHCRQPVYTPSDWDPTLAHRSADLPQTRLVLDFVYGYEGVDNTAQNLFYTSDGKVVYFTAGVGVVYHRPPGHRQHFYLGHTDDIASLAICRTEVTLDGRTYPERTLVATGQVTSIEEGPFISVWDSRAGNDTTGGGPAATHELVRIPFDKDARGITALAFSPSGEWLAAVATDIPHTVYVYDWRKQRCLFDGKGQSGEPPQVYGLEWSPYDHESGLDSFVTFGRNRIKMWTREKSNVLTWTSKAMSFGRLPMQHVTSAQWLPPKGASESMIVAGVADGSLYVFKGLVCVKSIAAHRPGPMVIQADGHPSHHGVRGLRLCKQGQVLLSGGADGTILQWDVSDGKLMDARFAGPSIQLKSPFGPGDKHAPGVRALDYSPELDKIIVGTINCDMSELTPSAQDGAPETLMDGHSGDVYSLAWHPTLPNILCTVSDSGHVHVWDTAARQMTYCAALGWTPRAVAFSTQPVPTAGQPDRQTYHIAVGGVQGHLKILDAGDKLRPLHKTRDSKEGVHEIKYSPNCRFMAVATFDTWIDIYNVTKDYSRVSRCMGHSSTVRCVDWSTDSSVVLSASADLELLTWNARTGLQITMPVRDMEYHTYTVSLGFPVMGIWPPGADGTEINSVDRSKSKQLVVTSDDHGMVKLFNYPCVVNDAPHRAYRGHSSHVMGVRFNSEDSIVCSVGGHDWSIFQFRVVHLQPEPAPPAPPAVVWGPLDPQGKAYGYTASPAQLANTATSRGDTPLQGSPAVASPSPSAHTHAQGQASVGSTAHSDSPGALGQEPSVTSLSSRAVGGAQHAQQGTAGVSQPSAGLPRSDLLQQNPAPTRLYSSGDEEDMR